MSRYRIEKNLAVLVRRARLFDEANQLVMSIERRKQYSPEQADIEGPAGPVVLVRSRTVQLPDPQYELFAADTGASLGFLRSSGAVLSPGHDEIGRAEDTAIVIHGRTVASLASDGIELSDPAQDKTLTIALLRAIPELWIPRYVD
jgi:hypothetical protein